MVNKTNKMKKGIFIKGSLKGYHPLEFKEPTRDIKGSKFKSKEGLEVSNWFATYTFNEDGVVITPHDQLKSE